MKRFFEVFMIGLMASGAFAGNVQITDRDTSVVAPVTSDGLAITQPTVAQVPFYVAVAAGVVDGYSIVNKFGHNATAGTGDDVWGGDGVYDLLLIEN